jgi:hypothetical protein
LKNNVAQKNQPNKSRDSTPKTNDNLHPPQIERNPNSSIKCDKLVSTLLPRKRNECENDNYNKKNALNVLAADKTAVNVAVTTGKQHYITAQTTPPSARKSITTYAVKSVKLNRPFEVPSEET